MRQKCVRNASKWVLFYWEKRNVQNASEIRQNCAKNARTPLGENTFWTIPTFGTFLIFPAFFPICSGMVRGFSRFVPFLVLGLLRAPTRNSPERVRDTIWTFPETSGKPPGLETSRLSFSQRKILAFSVVVLAFHRKKQFLKFVKRISEVYDTENVETAIKLMKQVASGQLPSASLLPPLKALPVVQMALQTQKNYFRIIYVFHSRYRYRRNLFWN